MTGHGFPRETPDTVCIVRLSAIGDCCHALPVIRTLQDAWPGTNFTWIIGGTESKLFGGIPDIEFLPLDKSSGFNGLRELRKQLRNRRFDLLLHMHPSMRANLASLFVRVDRRLGFDRKRARDLQWLFCNEQIPGRSRQHVMDSFFGFAESLGITSRSMRWDIPIPESDIEFSDHTIPDDVPAVIVSPCSSMMRGRQKNYRNWLPDRYAEVIDHANERWQASTFLTGGSSMQEEAVANAIITKCKHPPVDLMGKTTLLQLLAILKKASVLVCPDSGPGHMATAVGTPVVGLFASTNPARAAPYLSTEWLVNEYPTALFDAHGLSVEQAQWGKRIHSPEAMQLVQVADVCQQLDALLDKSQ